MSELLPVSLLIPTMNRPQTLQRTLYSILAGTALPAQIVVVDQSTNEPSRNQCQKVLDTLPDAVDKVFIHQNIPSSTAARNRAMAMARHDVMIFSDDDIEVFPNTLENIMRIMSNPEIAMIAGLDDNTPPSRSNIGYLLGTKSFCNRKIGHVTASMLGRYPDNVTATTPTQWAMGYFFVVRKSLCDLQGIKWDETLSSYAYAEDLDFSFSYYKAVAASGFRCILDPGVRVKHMVSREYRIPSRQSTWMYVVHRRYLSYKHGLGWRSRAAMNWCDFWRLVQRTIRREKPYDLIKAYWYYVRNKSKIRRSYL